jgi:Na+/H+ antiporter NhaD/arsenite permease-like protein
MNFIPIIILLIVFCLIAVRRVGDLRIKIWQSMLFGAVAVLVLGQISVLDALASINIDVMLFLFGMFVVGASLEESGYLSHLANKIFKHAKSANQIVLLVLFVAGISSAFLMNDTLAIIMTPFVLMLAKSHEISPKLLLLALAFAITIGSVMSPIGNPQNLLIAVNGNVSNPFITFAGFLLIPTLVNLLVAYFLLKFFYKKEFCKKKIARLHSGIKDKELALISKFSLVLICLLVAAKIFVVSFGIPLNFRLTYIALVAMLPILLFGKRRFEMVKKADWETLVFFAAMFVLTASVWQSGFFQGIIRVSKVEVVSVPMVMGISVSLSQLISNVPLVALYLPLLLNAGASTKALMALAAGSTIAGNLLILGAASNVIIIQNAEKRAGETITFLEFARIGIPLTIINAAVYWFFLAFV